MKSRTVSSATFGNAAKTFIDAGISDRWLIPVAPVNAEIHKTSQLDAKNLGKAPGRFNPENGKWSGLYTRDIYADGTTKREAASFLDWPTDSVGLVGKAFPAIDSDADSDVAAVLVLRALTRTFGETHGAAIRIRGKSPRRLFAFQAEPDEIVKSRSLKYRVKGETIEHGIDIKAAGGQYLIHGTHPSGDRYEWDPKASLADRSYDLTLVTNADMERFVANFTDLLTAQGGEIISSSTSGKGAGGDRDVSKMDPAMSFDDVMTGLDALPNTEANFPHRDNLVSVLAAIKAALGRDAEQHVDRIREWACNSSWDPDFCTEDYFAKCWDSLGHVRVPQDSLERTFRRSGLTHATAASFPSDDTAEIAVAVTKAKTVDKENRNSLLTQAAQLYAFRDANRLQGIDGCVVRDRSDVEQEIKAIDWWKQEAILSDGTMLATIQREDRYPPNKVGLANFLRDIRRQHSECFFYDIIYDPSCAAGDIVTETLDGKKKNFINMRSLSSAQVFGQRPTKTPEKDAHDVETILTLMRGIFGSSIGYELDTLAFMVQTGTRPGSMLFLVGDPGVGKSVYIEMLSLLFDGESSRGRGFIDGTKVANESSRRFAYATIEGCRIVSHRELPKNMSSRTLAEITAGFKTLVDRGIGGQYIMVEAKNVNTKAIRNVCRVVVSSNYMDAIEIEENDRRIFFVESGITLSSKLSKSFYKEFATVAKDPKRLAAFWRYLQNRDIVDYEPFGAPPMTNAKLAQQITNCGTSEKRHLLAAITLLEASGRSLVTAREIFDTMTLMSKNEKENSDGVYDDVMDYSALPIQSPQMRHCSAAFRSVPRDRLLKLDKEFRTETRGRLTIYMLAEGIKNDVVRALTNTGAAQGELAYDRERNKLVEHPLELYRSNR